MNGDEPWYGPPPQGLTYRTPYGPGPAGSGPPLEPAPPRKPKMSAGRGMALGAAVALVMALLGMNRPATPDPALPTTDPIEAFPITPGPTPGRDPATFLPDDAAVAPVHRFEAGATWQLAWDRDDPEAQPEQTCNTVVGPSAASHSRAWILRSPAGTRAELVVRVSDLGWERAARAAIDARATDGFTDCLLQTSHTEHTDLWPSGQDSVELLGQGTDGEPPVAAEYSLAAPVREGCTPSMALEWRQAGRYLVFASLTSCQGLTDAFAIHHLIDDVADHIS